ncbi:mediator of RNA polymerase II transcription subunit 22a-like [Aegilops tauschii subsp. strangulata]|uniref:mediator of RNA polymerase II transcription subunit 22a-like n=1 Tax=Aegilops tauschii subsp. strangulata TaxID=200361 RepID=UPI00098B5C06|nr:mediator of RNA polymerase II transcription subunit 22a-like [Aegilops tauschii subsp. strangulata]
MSNPGVGAGGATATVAAAASQKQRALLQKADADVGSLVANLSALIDIARVNDPPVHNSHVAFQMDGRPSHLVHSGDSLLKLVSELKRTAIFSGLASSSENVDRKIEVFSQHAEGTDRMLQRIGQEAATSLKELEAHYYSSGVQTLLTVEMHIKTNVCS